MDISGKVRWRTHPSCCRARKVRLWVSSGSAMSSLASLLSSNWYCWQGGWQIFQHPVGLPTALEAGEESHRRDLSSVFMTVGDAVTRSVLLWQPSELCRVHGSADTSLARHSDPRLLHSQEDLRHIHLLRVSPVQCAPERCCGNRR